MATPTSTYDSLTDLSLGQVPQGVNDETYKELLDLHNAIEKLITASDTADAIFAAYIEKQRNNTEVNVDYTVLITDGTLEIDATAGDITVTFPLAADGSGYKYDAKRVDLVTGNKVTLVGTGELIDGRASGINLSTKSSYTIKGNEADNGYNII